MTEDYTEDCAPDHDKPRHHCGCVAGENIEPEFPKGTLEYEAYAKRLSEELDKWLKGEGEYA